MRLASILLNSAANYLKAHPLSEADRAQVENVTDAMAIIDRLYSSWAAQSEPALEGLSPMQYLMEQTTVAEWGGVLIGWAEAGQGGTLPAPLRQVVSARLDELGPVLVELIDNEALWDDKSPGKGYAPVLAARLAGELGYSPAVHPLLRAVESTEGFTLLGDAAVHALKGIGEPARIGLYDLAERHTADVEGEPYTRAVEVLTSLPQDERTWQYLKRGLQAAEEMIGLYVVAAGDYGDRRALFHLNGLLEERMDLIPMERRECLESIEMLGGVPTARALAAIERMPLERNLFGGRVGRNDPCPCGSGKKYKKCCGK